MKSGCRTNYQIPKCTKDCPIILSCKRKFESPKECYHKPAQIGTNLSNAISNVGRRGILIVEGPIGKCRDVEELRLRIGVCWGCP